RGGRQQASADDTPGPGDHQRIIRLRITHMGRNHAMIISIRPTTPTLFDWDYEYLREHCVMEFNSIFAELYDQAEEFNYEIYPHEIEAEAERILAEWE